MAKTEIRHTATTRYTSKTGYGIAVEILDMMKSLKDIDGNAYFTVERLGVDRGSILVKYMWETLEDFNA